ncbi:TPA: hypothetical protein N0F65_002910 [Lagenidium giganteum]|uniref:Methyltransferase domain-containing protein n=1 Tax=Lagenidium giganteum TaxID=4803 RepID=A0AAV2Z6Y1_9STRA|nr:TPA: hypothetical protein N0F65_002910 [Lagenidium giganteum]
MVFTQARPEQRVAAQASASSAAAKRFYTREQASTYTTTSNANIQKDLTLYALELLRLASPSSDAGDSAMLWLLDMGAGSGLSTSAAAEWLDKQGFAHAVVVAFDISASMLALAQDDALKSSTVGAYCGNAAQQFPLREGTFDAAIGISMLQWLTPEGLRTCFTSLASTLGRHGRAVFQVYPETLEQVEAMEAAAKQAGFQTVEAFIAFPHSTTAKKWFLLVQRDQVVTEAFMPPQCLFARRFHRRCAWHYLQQATTERHREMRDRLAREHVKEAWHIWRKYKRSIEFQNSKQTADAIKHVRAKRSLELWKSDELIGAALRQRFETADVTISNELLMSHMNDVVDIIHKVRAIVNVRLWYPG